MAIDAEFLSMLVCPICRTELVLRGEDRLFCHSCRRVFPIRDDIPHLLRENGTIEEDASVVPAGERSLHRN